MRIGGDIIKVEENMSTIKELEFDNKNFNSHTEFGMSLLEKSLRENGAGRSILIDKDNRIIAGNGIVEAAGQIGLENVKIVETTGDEIVAVKRTDISLDSDQGREMALADNATAAADLSWDKEAIGEFFSPEDTQKWGLDLDWNEDKEIEEDEAPEIDENEPAKSELGKVYQLGNHRLMCGDSTDAGSVAILMDGQKADMVFTDPPYNVGFNGRSGKFDVIKNDDLPGIEFDSLIQKTCEVIKGLKPKNTYIWCNWKFYGILQKYIEPKACIVWAKNNFGMGKGYRHQHEFCMFNGEIDEDITTETDLWQENKDTNYEHPTQKPVSLCARALRNTKKAKTVLDLFGGSGSTLIACEQLGRKCYMMELDPKYCDVIRKRYWKFVTGSEEGWEDGTRAI